MELIDDGIRRRVRTRIAAAAVAVNIVAATSLDSISSFQIFHNNYSRSTAPRKIGGRVIYKKIGLLWTSLVENDPLAPPGGHNLLFLVDVASLPEPPLSCVIR